MKKIDTLRHIARCRDLAEHGEPLTLDEMREYTRLRAEEMARAERRRENSPQFLLQSP